MSVHDLDAPMRTPLKHARGLGSAQDGVRHWWMQRVTAVALALLLPWFAWLALSMLGAGQDDWRAVLANPRYALPLLMLVLAMFWHAKLGMQVVIEDYVHTRWLEIALHLLNTFACIAGALAGVFGIARCMFAP
ncbi:MAG: succinate dehydrogenase, hydrophobic membrane anchor protein [Proteobacteria bacterium]|nr:succinate dehydrogenase, hydrophobic membrane anchor protein [Pseudomonadota bacterium]